MMRHFQRENAKRVASLVLGLALVAVVACEASPTAEPSEQIPPDTVGVASRDTMPLVQTQDLGYEILPNSWGRGAMIPFAYRNVLADTLYIVNCGGVVAPSVEKLDSTGWKPIWSPIVQACLSTPIKIPPGGFYQGVANFSGAPFGSNVYPQLPAGDLNGTYRLRINNVVLHYDSMRQGFGSAVPVEMRVSNGFLIKDPGA